jgi:hypothetical protein
LRWKQGEYQALSKLSPIAQELILPVIEVAEIGFDFESRTYCKTIDEHLFPFAKRVKEKWGGKECFVDIRHVETSSSMSDGQHPATFVFTDLRLKGVLATPVIGMNLDSTYQGAIHKVVTEDGRGLCIRVKIEEVVKVNFNSSIQNLISTYCLAIEQCDLIIDLRAPNFEPIDGFAGLLSNVIAKLPNLNLWRSITIVSTSFPSTLSGINPGLLIIPRNEWRLYKLLVTNLKKLGARLPSFGDYAINHPDQLQMDMRLMKPNASVRYTINDDWLIAKGKNVRDYGYAQYEDLCRMVIESNYYSGQGFSAGDEYILSCANKIASTGNLTTWRWVGTNHHIEMVARDAANLSAS